MQHMTFFYYNQKYSISNAQCCFPFDCENSFAAHSAFYFLEYWLKWLFKCKRLQGCPTFLTRGPFELIENIGGPNKQNTPLFIPKL